MDDCIHWIGAKTSDGYGKRQIKGKRYKAHRLAWVEAYGPIPPGLSVLHICDQRSCVNPQHLWLGTRGDNNTDRNKKRRSAYGKQNGNGKLSSEQVAEIKTDSRSSVALAPLYGVSRHHIRKIRRGERRQST